MNNFFENPSGKYQSKRKGDIGNDKRNNSFRLIRYFEKTQQFKNMRIKEKCANQSSGHCCKMEQLGDESFYYADSDEQSEDNYNNNIKCMHNER